MLAAVMPVRSLLLAIFVLMAGSGFLATLTAVRLERAGFGALAIGLVGTAYFVGLMLGSLRFPLIVRRVGHIRAFAAVVSLFSASTLAYAIHEDALLWSGLRFVDGICVAGVFVCLESWLNERAEAVDRGSVLAGYMIALYAGQALGQFLLNLSDAKPSMPFLVASMLISLAVIPVALTRISAPPTDYGATLSLRRLYAISPLGAVGSAATGLMLGAFYALGAVYVRRLGMDLAGTARFMSVVILGGVALQWPLGRLSDRFDRRRVIVAALGGTVAASAGIAAVGTPGLALLALAALFGGLSFALYPLCVAHTNDHLEPAERVSASGGLVLLYSIGAAAGPMTGAVAMTLFGPAGLFLGLALVAAAAFVFGLWRQWRTDPVPAERQGDYQVLPRTTPMIGALDPLSPATPAREETLWTRS